MNIVMVASEAFPFAKTGGLGDVIGSLPKALGRLGHEVRVFIPKYSLIPESAYNLKHLWDLGDIYVPVGDQYYPINVYQGKLPGSDVIINFIDCAHFFSNRWIYTNDPDEDERFILFNRAVLEVLIRKNIKPDIFHCNDWQSGIIPALIKTHPYYKSQFPESAIVYTVHNIGYAGKFHQDGIWKAGLSYDYFYPGGPLEFYESFSFMKSGLFFADKITTVSKTYAQEILTPEFGAGFEGLLKFRQSDLLGIINGVDYDIWNPEVDEMIPFKYNLDNLENKEKNKQYLLKMIGMNYKKDRPLFGIISRLVVQKGFGLLAPLIDSLVKKDIQLIVLGSGEAEYEYLFNLAHKRYPEKVFTFIGYDNELSHLIEAGADIFLMPSIYEPCGLNQIYSLKYGTVPIVRKTGGLADTIFDWDERQTAGASDGNGFSFFEKSPYALYQTIERALHYYHQPKTWKKIIQNGMKMDYSWDRSAESYIQLFKKAKVSY